MSKYDLLLHVDKTDGSLPVAFTNAINYAKALPEETFSMVLVVNARAVTLLTVDNADIKDALEKAQAHGLSISVCGNALKATGTNPQDLYPGCRVVPAGIVELVTLQREGYAYVKP